MLQPLKGLVEAIRKTDASPQWLFVGDYVNRGPDSKGVIEFLLHLPQARFCRGNHDDIFDLILNGKCFAEDVAKNNRSAAFRWFMEHGLAETFASYGVDLGQMQTALTQTTHANLEALISRVPSSHRRFIRDLLPVIEESDLFVTHARWDPAVPDEDPSLSTYLEVDMSLRKTATWGRFTPEELDCEKTWRRTGYFGHTPVDSYGARGGYDPNGGGRLIPIIANKVVLLDTAAALSPVGRLTAYCPELSQFIQVDRQGNLIHAT